MGGWAGEIVQMVFHDFMGIRWNQQTLDAMHPVFKSRCEKHEVEVGFYGLWQHEVEPDLGGPLEIEPPTEIKTKPLDPNEQEDRVRMVFGLTDNDPLPRVDEEKLTVFHGHLSENLAFPFEAEYPWQGASPERVRRIAKVTGLLGADRCSWMDGLLCEGRLDKEGFERPLTWFEVAEDDPKLQPLVDYYYWFYNYQ